MDNGKSQIILKDGIYYFDWTASGLAHKGVEKQINQILLTYSNTHSECGSNAKNTSELYEFARSKLKDYLELGEDFYLLGCGFGSTGALKKFWELMGIYIPPATKDALFCPDKWQELKKHLPLVIVGPYEHHSNELALRYMACESVRVGLGADGGFDFEALGQILSQNAHRKIILSINATSNVTGLKTNTAKLRELVTSLAPKAIIALDASSLIAHENIPSSHFDALFISPHKLLGGPGACGLLAIRKNLVESASLPSFAGGGTVEYVSRSSARFVRSFEQLEDAGTPPITQLIRAYLAFRVRNEQGLEWIKSRENELMDYFEKGLKSIENIKCYCPLDLPRAPIYAFNCLKASCYDFAKELSEKYSIQARAGCSCAGPYGHDLLGLSDDFEPYFKPGWVRVSLHYTQDFSDIDYLLGAIKSCVKHFC